MTQQEYKRVTEVTYLGFVYGTLAALKRMLPRNRGTIVRVGSALANLVPSALDGALMSGSGSAYFGLGRDLAAARHAAASLETLGLGRVRVVTCGPLRPPRPA